MPARDAEHHGFDPSRLARLDTTMASFVDAGKIPGIQLLVSRHGELVHRHCYGFTDVEAQRRVEEDTLYRIYSMTKPVTSVALMMLLEEGELLLENPVSRFIPEFAEMRVYEGGNARNMRTRAAARTMTVRDVLTHMSGLTYGFFESHPVDALYRHAHLGEFIPPDHTLEEAMSRLAEIPLLHEPATRWNYSMSTDVVGRIVEVVSGKGLDEFFAERIFGPLGMTDTAFAAPESELARCSPLYMPDRSDSPSAMMKLFGPETMVQQPKFLSGGGGLVGTADDYLAFAHMLLGRGALGDTRLLGSRTVEAMTRNHLPGGATLAELGQSTFSEVSVAGHGFGLGFSVVTDAAAAQVLGSAGTFGWGGAASTNFWVDPVEEICCVFMTQLLPSDSYPLRPFLRNAVYQALVD
jgi:CubicO group peptidase (beta-lactamase class C family)